MAVFSGHGLIRPNTHRTFCGSGGYDLCRAAGYDASLLDAVRTRSEGGRSSHTRMHSFTHNPRRTQHGARTTQSPPRRAIQRTHDARTTARTSTRMLPRLAGLPTETRSGQARILHAVIPILQGKASARAPFLLSINQTRPQDSISALSSSFYLCAMSSSQGLQYTSSALSARFLWCGSSCSQGFQEIFSALPLHCSFVSTELPSRLATLRLRLPCIILWVCTEQLSRHPRHLLCSICNALYECTELLSRLSRCFFCSACIVLFFFEELREGLPRPIK